MRLCNLWMNLVLQNVTENPAVTSYCVQYNQNLESNNLLEIRNFKGDLPP